MHPASSRKQPKAGRTPLWRTANRLKCGAEMLQTAQLVARSAPTVANPCCTRKPESDESKVPTSKTTLRKAALSSHTTLASPSSCTPPAPLAPPGLPTSRLLPCIPRGGGTLVAAAQCRARCGCSFLFSFFPLRLQLPFFLLRAAATLRRVCCGLLLGGLPTFAGTGGWLCSQLCVEQAVLHLRGCPRPFTCVRDEVKGCGQEVRMGRCGVKPRRRGVGSSQGRCSRGKGGAEESGAGRTKAAGWIQACAHAGVCTRHPAFGPAAML